MKVKLSQSTILSISIALMVTCITSSVSALFGGKYSKDIVPKLLRDAVRDYTQVTNLQAENPFSLNFPQRRLKREYDFIIVGSGPAGCVLGNRLSEGGKFSVLILEAGGTESPITSDLPISSPNLQTTSFNWGYSTTVQDRACLGMGNSSCHWPHGKVLGGSSLLYYMIYTRGNRRDFDSWARAGNPGWSWDDVLPYFMKSENATLQFANPFVHGTGGPVKVEDVPFRSPISYAHVQAAREAGYKYVDYNSGDQIGVSFLQQSTRNGRRITAARAFLHPVQFRKNLHIATQSTVKKLVMDEEGEGYNHVNGRSVKGVVVKQLGSPHDVFVRARKEVILSAGAFESPKLLMLSGVGPAQQLRHLDIPLVKDLPVGQTMYEHMGVMGPMFTMSNVNDGIVNLDEILTIKNIAEYYHGRGPLTMNGVESLTYIKTNSSGDPDPGNPDVEIMQAFASISFDSGGGMAAGLRLREDLVEQLFKPLQNQRTFFYLPMLLHPRSKGHLRLQSNNYLDYPILEPNFFSDWRDLESLVDGVYEAIRLAGQPSMLKLGPKVYTPQLPTCPEVVPGSRDYWRCWVMTISATFHHQVGTCKMGPPEDPTTVVDHNLRVHGFSNLRVADIGIIPKPPSGHTNAYSMMIGEKASDMIKETWSGSGEGGEREYYDISYNDVNYQSPPQYQQPPQQRRPALDQREPIYQPKYFEYRKKRSVSFDWQKSSSREEEAETATTQKVQVQEKGSVTEESGAKKEGKAPLKEGLSLLGPEKVVPSGDKNAKTASPSRDKLSDLLSVLRPSDVDISHDGGGNEKEEVIVKKLAALAEKSGITEIIESIPAIDEDEIRTVTLDNHTQFDKGQNKPQRVTEMLASTVNTTHFEAQSFRADNSTKAIHLPVLDGKLEHEEEARR